MDETVMMVKKCIQANRSIPLFRQRLALNGDLLDTEVLACLPRPIRLALVELADVGVGARLMDAARRGDAQIAKQILYEPAFPDPTDPHGATPLHIASHTGCLEIVQLLIEAGADKDKAQQHGATPLYIACATGRDGVYRAVLTAECDVNKAMSGEGATPLYIGRPAGHEEVYREVFAAEFQGKQSQR